MLLKFDKNNQALNEEGDVCLTFGQCPVISQHLQKPSC